VHSGVLLVARLALAASSPLPGVARLPRHANPPRPLRTWRSRAADLIGGDCPASRRARGGGKLLLTSSPAGAAGALCSWRCSPPHRATSSRDGHPSPLSWPAPLLAIGVPPGCATRFWGAQRLILRQGPGIGPGTALGHLGNLSVIEPSRAGNALVLAWSCCGRMVPPPAVSPARRLRCAWK